MYIVLSALSFAVFHRGFPETKQSFLDFWIRGIPIKKSNDGLIKITKDFAGLYFLQFSWICILAMFIPLDDSYAGFPDVGPLVLLCAILLTIIVEELCFRGIFLLTGFGILRVFHKDWSYALGLVSSILFGLVHLTNYPTVDLWALLWITSHTISGLVLWWFAKRYSIAASIYAQVLFNAVVILPGFLFMK